MSKHELLGELARRITYFEETYQFTLDMAANRFVNDYVAVAYGRYCAMCEMRWQIENGLFIGGFAA